MNCAIGKNEFCAIQYVKQRVQSHVWSYLHVRISLGLVISAATADSANIRYNLLPRLAKYWTRTLTHSHKNQCATRMALLKPRIAWGSIPNMHDGVVIIHNQWSFLIARGLRSYNMCLRLWRHRWGGKTVRKWPSPPLFGWPDLKMFSECINVAQVFTYYAISYAGP